MDDQYSPQDLAQFLCVWCRNHCMRWRIFLHLEKPPARSLLKVA